ncbi:hydrolase 76 protein [Podochytrium sp. JEL0797]|nr:hydrolase 76 protein [Podochytrium sp. JEL0797]
MQLKIALSALALSAQAQQTLNLGDKGGVLAAAKAAMGPLQQYFKSPNLGGLGAWQEQSSSGRWGMQWHESGQFYDVFYQYALASGDGSNNAFANAQMHACDNGNGDFFGGSGSAPQDHRWNDDVAWWALSSQSGAEATGDAALKSLSMTTFNQVWLDWDDACGGGIYWSRDRNPSSSNPYLKSTITNVQMMDLAARLGETEKFNQIWSWLKSSGLVVDNGNGGYIIYDNIMTNGCHIEKVVYSKTDHSQSLHSF